VLGSHIDEVVQAGTGKRISMSVTSEPESEEVDSEATPEPSAPDERLTYRGVFQRLFIRPEIGALIGAGAIWAFFWAVTLNFGNAGGILPVFAVASTLGIMAVAVSVLMIGGEFDLSSGAATGAFGIVTILLVKDIGELGGAGLSLWVAIPLSLVVALSVGWINGTVVERTGLPSFIVTLATFFVLRGFKLGFSKLAIDNITVGTIDEAEGRGYEFWQKIFASTWVRNDHSWESRDAVYTILVLGGIALVVAAVYELAFARREKMNLAGLPVLMAGLALVVGGILYMHNSDGVSANTVAGIIIGAGIIVAAFGLAWWRYQPQAPGSFAFSPLVLTRTLIGVGLVAVATVLAVVVDMESQRSVLDLAGPFTWPVVVLAGALGVYALPRMGSLAAVFRPALGNLTALFSSDSVLLRYGSAFVGAAALAYGFMFMATEQGLRAIVFAVAAVVGLMVLATAIYQARSAKGARLLVQTVTAAAVVALAFFIRWQSTSVKFRSELFSVLLVVGVLLFTWGLVSAFFAQRRFADRRSDRLGSLLAVVGIVAAIAGLAVKLLFTTEAELAANIPRAQFRVEFLWFIIFTAAITFMLEKTRFGSWVYAVGGNKQAARQVGVPAARTKTQLFMIVSAAAWLVGLLLAFRLNTLQSGTGNGLEFEYIIAAVVGGTLLTGGYGSAFGASIGALIMAMSVQGIPAARWNSDWRFAFLGAILLTAVIANNYIRTKAEALR